MEKPRDLWFADIMLASGTVKKVIEINPYLLGTMAGGAGESFLSFFLGFSNSDLTLGCFE